jgi:hypothetical protein
MHTGKEGTEAMPYFDTFDLETIDILLISQYVLSFPFSVSAVVDEHLEEGGLGFSNDEDSKTKMTTPRDSHHCRRVCSSRSLGITSQSDCTIRADRSPSSYF